MYVEGKNKPIYVAKCPKGSGMCTFGIVLLLAGLFLCYYWLYGKDVRVNEVIGTVDVVMFGGMRSMGTGTYIMLGVVPSVALAAGGIVAMVAANAMMGTYLMLYDTGVRGCALQEGYSTRRKYFDLPLEEITNCVWTDRGLTIQKNMEGYTICLAWKDAQWILQYLSARVH